jgi:tetratricopeptide (TPR) repeat protein
MGIDGSPMPRLQRFAGGWPVGLIEGDQLTLQPMPVSSTEWELGTPDLILTMPAYTLRADGPDRFRNFVIPVPNDRLRYVRAWEFRAGNPRVVHHATMQVDASGRSRRYDESDPESGYEGLIAPSARAPDGFFLDWAPGHRAGTAVPGTAWPLPARSDAVMMLHLRPTGRTETVEASFALYFSERAPDRTPVMLRLTRQDLDIAAGAKRYSVSDTYVLPVDVDVYTVQPHAHYLAREMTAAARCPDGTSVPLLKIRDWDFNWQEVYHYSSPIRLAAGTRVAMTISYDNTSENPRNPNNPPQRVTYGQQTSDEMAEMWFQVIPVHGSDRGRLVESLYRKVLPEEIRGRTAMSRADPGSVPLHDDLALMLADAGDTAGAEREFRASLALRPASAAALFNVGMAVLGRGDRQQARKLFEAALTTDPSYAPAHFELGLMITSDGNLIDAAAHLTAAAEARPTDPEVLLATAVVDGLQGNEGQAVARLRRALTLSPSWPDAEAALAAVLTRLAAPTMEDRREAIALAQDAVTRTGHSKVAYLEILADAYTVGGRPDLAVEAVSQALDLAQQSSDNVALSRLRARLAVLQKP